MQKGHIDNNNIYSNKNSFFKSYKIDIFLFVTSLISLVVTAIVSYIVCKHAKLKSLVTSFTLQQIKGMDMVLKQDMINDIHCTCET